MDSIDELEEENIYEVVDNRIFELKKAALQGLLANPSLSIRRLNSDTALRTITTMVEKYAESIMFNDHTCNECKNETHTENVVDLTKK